MAKEEIKKIKIKRELLEKEIETKVNLFIEETGLEPRSIVFDTNKNIDGLRILNVRVDLKL